MQNDQKLKEKELDYLKGSGAEFHTLLKFWLKAASVDNTLMILVPSKDLVTGIRQSMIPQLTRLCEKENGLEVENTLKHTIKFLFFYYYMTSGLREADKNDPRLLELLPLLVDLGERLL